MIIFALHREKLKQKRRKKYEAGKTQTRRKNSYFAAFHIARVLWMEIIYDVFDVGKAWFEKDIQNTCSERRTNSPTRRIAFRSDFLWIESYFLLFIILRSLCLPSGTKMIFKVARFKRGLKWTWVYNKKILKRRSFELRVS